MALKNNKTAGIDNAKVEGFMAMITDVKAYDCKSNSKSTWKVDKFVSYCFSGIWISGFKIMTDGKARFLAFPSTYNASTKESYPNSWLDKDDFNEEEKKKIYDLMLSLVDSQ